MEIPQKAKKELKSIYRRQSGKTLTDQQIEAMAQNLFHLIDAIYQPIPKEWFR